MSQRNMEKIAKEMTFKVPTAYQMTLEELQRLMMMDDWAQAIGTAFDYGFALALRMVEREAQKARKAAAAGNQGV